LNSGFRYEEAIQQIIRGLNGVVINKSFNVEIICSVVIDYSTAYSLQDYRPIFIAKFLDFHIHVFISKKEKEKKDIENLVTKSKGIYGSIQFRMWLRLETNGSFLQLLVYDKPRPSAYIKIHIPHFHYFIYIYIYIYIYDKVTCNILLSCWSNFMIYSVVIYILFLSQRNSNCNHHLSWAYSFQFQF
jgi:hypothetical protein